MKTHFLFTALVASATSLLASVAGAQAQTPDLSIKGASPATIAANRAFAAGRRFDSPLETDFATRGFIAALDEPQIKDAKGDVVFDVAAFDALSGPTPDTVNPSLWESSKLLAKRGLFKLADGIYQVRNYDIEDMTLVQGKTGWIVIDPMMSMETAKAAMGLVDKQLGKRPISALIYSHPHADHFGGARGIVDEADVKAGKVRVIAPAGFMDSAVAENVLAGNAMARRAQYQAGGMLPVGAKGQVGMGVAIGMSTGTIGLIPPTEVVTHTGEELTVDGVRMVFELAPETEAPAEFLFYFPDMKALFWAEDVNKSMHNIYTLRGTKARDALGWSKYINQLLDLFPDAELAFGPHTWPTWGNAEIRKQLVYQRDMYRFIHDQALFLTNQGKTMDDLANATFYPKALKDNYSTRGYYSSLSQNLRGVYRYYLGYYDSNPATLDRYTPAETARRYVAELGGAKAVLQKGRKAFAAGDYRWTAELVNHLVLAEPTNMQARALQADALEQLGYQAETSVWRNEYLSAAQELRHGVKSAVRFNTQGPDLLRALTPDMVFDMLAVRLNHEKADGLNIGINIDFTDSGDKYALELSNSVLNNTKGRILKNPNVTLSLSTAAFMKMTAGKVPLADLMKTGEVRLDGDPKALAAVFANLETPDPMFSIVAP